MWVQAVHGVLRRGDIVVSYYSNCPRRICPKFANAFDPPCTDDAALLTQLVITGTRQVQVFVRQLAYVKNCLTTPSDQRLMRLIAM